MLIVIIILVFVILALMIYNMSIHKKIQTFHNMSQRVTNLNILQDFMNIVGKDMDVDKKIQAINEVMIEKYEIKYSTIVVFDGTEYIIKASNVSQRHWEALKSLHEVDIFKDSIAASVPKYITVNNDNERLPYQREEFGRSKSAIFFPLYIDNVYIGYWIIESGVPHDFDNIDTTIFETVRENIVTVLKTVDYQKTLENIVRTDLFTGLKTVEYLYAEGKKTIDNYAISAVCMFKIVNIEEINKISRELGNKVITETSKYIEDNIAESYIFVRYMGPKFVIVFCGVESDSVTDFINSVKESVEKLQVSLEENFEVKEISTKNDKKKSKLDEKSEESKEKSKKGKRKKKVKIATPQLNFVVSSYYKGTGMEEVLGKMEKYLDEDAKDNSEIVNI